MSSSKYLDIPTELIVEPVITDTGISIRVNEQEFPIEYPRDVWNATSAGLKNRLLSNLSMASTLYLPQILNLRSITYKTNRPIGESFFLRNGIYDAPYCANVDGKSSVQYLKDFFNTRYLFTKDDIEVPENIKFEPKNDANKNVKL